MNCNVSRWQLPVRMFHVLTYTEYNLLKELFNNYFIVKLCNYIHIYLFIYLFELYQHRKPWLHEAALYHTSRLIFLFQSGS